MKLNTQNKNVNDQNKVKGRRGKSNVQAKNRQQVQ